MTPSLWGALRGTEVAFSHWHRSYTLFAVLWAAFMLCLLQAPAALQGVFGWMPLRVFGVVSFSGYLWHALLLENLDWMPFRLDRYPAAATMMAVLVVVSVISYALIERPFLRIGRARRIAANAGPGAPATAVQSSG